MNIPMSIWLFFLFEVFQNFRAWEKIWLKIYFYWHDFLFAGKTSRMVWHTCVGTERSGTERTLRDATQWIMDNTPRLSSRLTFPFFSFNPNDQAGWLLPPSSATSSPCHPYRCCSLNAIMTSPNSLLCVFSGNCPSSPFPCQKLLLLLAVNI